MTSDRMRPSGNSRPWGVPPVVPRLSPPGPVAGVWPGGDGPQSADQRQIRWQGSLIYLSETLRGEPVGLVPHDDRYWTIQYGPVQLGRLDAHTGQVLPTATNVLPLSPV